MIWRWGDKLQLKASLKSRPQLPAQCRGASHACSTGTLGDPRQGPPARLRGARSSSFLPRWLAGERGARRRQEEPGAAA